MTVLVGRGLGGESAVYAVFVQRRRLRGLQRFTYRLKRLFDPPIVAVIRYEIDVEF